MKSKQNSFYINVNKHTEEGEMSNKIRMNYEKGKLFFDESISLQLITDGWITIKDRAEEIRELQMEQENRYRI